MQRILLDTDTGVDDALAIILALNSPELNVEAITSVSGNVHVDLCTRNSVDDARGNGGGGISNLRQGRIAAAG